MSNVTAFDGAIPGIYDRYLRPILFEEYARDMAARVPADARDVLEVACGTGIVTRHLLQALPAGATLVATDLNPAMLAEAERQVAPDGRLTLRQADAMALPFDAAAFDAVVSQFGVMFFPDKLQAFREARRVLKAGGTYLFSAWDAMERNAFAQTISGFVREQFPDHPPTFYDVPFSFADPALMRSLLAEAGFREVDVQHVRKTGHSPSARDAATGFIRGNPLATELSERGVDLDDVISQLTDRVGRLFGAAPRFELSAFVATAR